MTWWHRHTGEQRDAEDESKRADLQFEEATQMVDEATQLVHDAQKTLAATLEVAKKIKGQRESNGFVPMLERELYRNLKRNGH